MTETTGDARAPGHSAAPDEPVETPRAWYAVFIFSLALMMNFVDRGIINLLVEPIKQDLQVSDTEISLLVGFAFVLFQIFVGLPLARLVDTKSRRLILGLSIAGWSGMTAVCGLTQTYWQLFLARIGSGIGEAANGPATFSMLSDLFPKHRLPRAIAVMQLGFASGQGLSLLLGGVLFAWLSMYAPYQAGIFGELKAWQMTFIVIGLPGLLIALLMATVREPKRHGQIKSAAGASEALPVREVARFLHANGRTYYPLFIGMGLKTVLSFGYGTWIPAFYIRTFDWSLAKVGWVQGGIMLLVWPVALFCGSFLAEHWAKKGRDDANMRVVLFATWAAVPFSILYPLMPVDWLAAVMVGVFYFFAMMVPGPQNAAMQVVSPNQMRGQVMALYLFVFNIIGFGLGPTVVALFTDVVFGDPADLKYAMALAASIIGPIAGLLFWYGLKPYARSVARAREWS